MNLRLLGLTLALAGRSAFAGEAPTGLPVSSHDRVYLCDEISNTVSVLDPGTNHLLGVIRLGDLTPSNLSPLYRGQLLVHGLGLAPDGSEIAVVSIGSNAVTFIDTATNRVKHTTYIGRSPHEATFTRDGKEVWVTVRGENYVQVLDAHTFAAKDQIVVPDGPGMVTFSPDGAYAYIVSSFTPETLVVDTASRRVLARIPQASPFSPNLAVTPDGKQLWFTLKDTGRTQVISAKPPFGRIALLETGPISNHVNIVHNRLGQFAYVTVGGLNEVKVYSTTDRPQLLATINVGQLPHGIWPSGDGSRVYVGLENGNAVTVIDTLRNEVVTTVPSGQSPQALGYVPNAVPTGTGTDNLVPLGELGASVHLSLAAVGADPDSRPSTTLSLDNQGLVDQLEAAVTGLKPKTPYLLVLSSHADGSGPLEPISRFVTNPAGAAIVSAIGPLKKVAESQAPDQRRYFAIVAISDGQPGALMQVQQVKSLRTL